ncbi:hypothetical protein C8F01DRAFT_1048962 [Mycena amicta]|nr:hypothetical protein C8F01DRAFT_1048962 [Mycena amicta]
MDDIDDDQLRPRISIDTMRAWITIKTELQREIETEARDYATQHNLPPDSILQSAKIVRSVGPLSVSHSFPQYTNEIFRIAQANIRVNGRDYDSLQPHEQDAEPFDEALDRQIWALAGTRLEWFHKIASERREKPTQIAAALAADLKEQAVLEEQCMAQLPSFAEDEDMDPSPILHIDDSVTREILAVSRELTQTIPAQQERAERARRVEAEIKALRP